MMENMITDKEKDNSKLVNSKNTKKKKSSNKCNKIIKIGKPLFNIYQENDDA